jgi:hypothetical protein
MEALISHGHRPEDVWGYTPRQMVAWLHFASKRRRAEAADGLVLNAMAARGDPKDIKAQIEKLGGPT